jgi:RNase P subunit RPR2
MTESETKTMTIGNKLNPMPCSNCNTGGDIIEVNVKGEHPKVGWECPNCGQQWDMTVYDWSVSVTTKGGDNE